MDPPLGSATAEKRLVTPDRCAVTDRVQDRGRLITPRFVPLLPPPLRSQGRDPLLPPETRASLHVSSSTEPLRVRGGAVEDACCLVQLEFAERGELCRLFQ